MTKKRYDQHSTEFGLWLRDQKKVDSSKGYIATNIDYVWHNYLTGKWVVIEEKRYMAKVAPWQNKIFNLAGWCFKHHPKFDGFFLLQFEKTSPIDGKIFLNGMEITVDGLLDFLQFKKFTGENNARRRN